LAVSPLASAYAAYAASRPATPPPPEHLQAFAWHDAATWRNLLNALGSFAVNLTVAVLILVLTVWLANWAAKVVARGIGRLHSKRGADRTLAGFAASLARYVVVIIGLIAVLQQLGIRTTSIIAVLGAASLAIGLAVQGTLANVAAGVMILLLRPYRVADEVEIAGKRGKVRALDLFSTELTDPDNVRVMVPNGKAFGDIIVNYSKPAKRRIELKFGVDYSDNLDKAIAVAIACAREDRRILDEPEPWAKVTDLADSAVIVTLRAYVMPSVYWNTRYDLIKRVKEAYDREGLHFPYPHQVGLSRQELLDAPPAPTSPELSDKPGQQAQQQT
jgi:small conductance mechanosensitive channel